VEVLRLPDNCYLDGYWQSEKYFIDHLATIRHDFYLPTPVTAQDGPWLRHIRNTLSVSLHVRPGDYARDPNVAGVHGTCTPDYYARALCVSWPICWTASRTSSSSPTIHYGRSIIYI
jgi:hypothetical protein